MKTKMIRMCAVSGSVIILVLGITGCTHVGNKSWSDMTDEERVEARGEFQKIRKELAEEFSKDSLEYRISNIILNGVEERMEEED